ncbi:carboxypeptidase regulatory-like domain-containing protein [bacterium]|nr:carboxypeptidase regulatory-like domain-containing protein [bacterium]
MQRITRLFVLTLLLIVVGAAFAGKARGPEASLVSKSGEVHNISPGVSAFRLPEVGSRRPGSLDEVIISEDFEDYANGSLPPGWTQVDVDNGSCPVTGFGGFSRWIVFSGIPAHSGTKFVANAYNAPPVPNNDWLILPQQNLTGEITLSYWAASQDPSYLETFEIRVSTTGSTPADFTNLVSTHVDVPSTYTQYTDDLSAYAGSPFYIAFHYTSVDEFILKVDDILLEAGEAAPTGTISGTVTNFETSAPIVGATVEIEGGGSTETDANGAYSFDVPAGTYTLTASAQSFEDETIAGVEVVVEQTTTVDFALVPSSTVTTDYPSAATPVNIPDQSPTGANKTMTITDDFLIEDLDVTVNITHTWVSDLDLYLISPWGDTVQLAEDPTTFPPGANMTNCRFDDEAAVAFNYETLTAPFTGSWQPFEELGAFEGFTTQGIWTLRAVDNEQADVGSIGVFIVHVLHEASAVGPRGEGIPTGFAMHEAFPNPFNPSTRIDFDVPATTNGELKIYNSLGQEVATLVSGQLATGLHSVYFDASALTSGIYFAQLRAGSFVATQKLVLMK